MRTRHLSIVTSVVPAGALALSLFVAACGSGSSSSSVPSALTQAQTQQQGQQDAVRFAGCMRSHGVSNFPDPTTSPSGFKIEFKGTKSPAFEAAATACQHLLPSGGPKNQGPAHSPAQIAALLAFTRCLRSHGYPNFPDPAGSGDVTHEMVAAAGINLHQPAVLQAGDACVGVTHGVITKEVVARFAAGQ